ncbi:MAG: DHH family phosphoesterase [Patescibacteria group bacterium]|nr:DHH family phosphoesterase [Patescibacteria group bacterium]
MELSPKQQINELIKTSQSILVVSHANLDGDALGAMLALDRVLTKMGKEVSLVTSNDIDDLYKFLPGISKIKSDISGTRDFILRFDTTKVPIEKLSYNKEEPYVNVVISPKSGKITQSDIEYVQGDFKFDLVFVLDTPDVDRIDSVYDRQTELFFETAIINIDHHAGNEYFGAVNLVDLTATSTCEILVSIIESFGAGNFDEDVATCLLTGITYDTGSFKYVNTTPKSLTISAQMLAAGARQQEIIQNLYKTKSINTLKLWGEVLTNINYNQEYRFAWSAISYGQMLANQASMDDIKALLDELLTNVPNTGMVLILAETEQNKVSGLLKSTNGSDILKLVEKFSGSGNAHQAQFEITKTTLKEASEKVLAEIKNAQGILLGLPINQSEPKHEKNNTEIITENAEVVIDKSKPEDPISKAIESIDSEIEVNGGELPSIDIEDTKNPDQPMKPLGKILENHQPGTALDIDEERIPYSPSETSGLGNQNEEIRTWKADQ